MYKNINHAMQGTKGAPRSRGRAEGFWGPWCWCRGVKKGFHQATSEKKVYCGRYTYWYLVHLLALLPYLWHGIYLILLTLATFQSLVSQIS